MKSLKLCLMTLYHPIVVTEHIKRHRGEKKNWLPVIVLLVLTLAVRILSIHKSKGLEFPVTIRWHRCPCARRTCCWSAASCLCPC